MPETKEPEPVARGRVCSNCTAVVSSQNARFCEFCGAELPSLPAGARPYTPHDQRREMFVRLREHPDLERLLQDLPTAPRGTPRSFSDRLLLSAAIGVIPALMLYETGDGSGPRPLVPIAALGAFGAVLALFAFVALTRASTKARTRPSPIPGVVARPVIVIDERVHVSGGGEKTRAQTAYFATLEDETGSRQEFGVSGSLAPLLAPNDAGVAYLREGQLLKFARIVV